MKDCVLDMFSVMINSVVFFSDVQFLKLHAAFELVPKIFSVAHHNQK
jgi:hypothetical protein